MRNIYFIRHAMPCFPNNDKYCIGQSDFPLCDEGRGQASILKNRAEHIIEGKPVFCSKLSRAMETAKLISHSPIAIDGLEEMHAGLWDGLSFGEIEKRWPEIFAKRDQDKNIPIPGAEKMDEGLERFKTAVKKCLEISVGDIIIVAHSTVIQAFLAHAASTPLDECRKYKLPYCSVSKVIFDGTFHIDYYGKDYISEK